MNRLPDTATIMACRQKVDFYLWKGIPVARSWPRELGPRDRSPAEVLTQQRMAAVAAMTGGIDEDLRALYKASMGYAQGVTWVDFFRSRAMVGPGWVVAR